LDGLRALSILFVIFGHLGGTRGFPIGGQHVYLPFLASLGVRVFFVISGYLITRLLLIERRERGSIYLPTFYFRRAFRILVPYYVFLAAMVCAAQLGLVELHPGDMGYALAYLSNYHLHHAWTLAHTWSLAVEEQFYLLWPALLVLVGVRRSMWVAAAFLLAAPMTRLGVWYLEPALRDGIGHTFETVVDSLAVGCVLAGVTDRLWARPRYRALLGSRWLALVPCAILAVGLVDDRPRIAFTLSALVINLGVALCVDHCLRFPRSLPTRVLSLPPLIAIGRVSYSIYLWQQPFLNREATGLPSHFPANLLAAAAVSALAYFAVEKPALTARLALEAWLRPVLGRSRAPKPAAAPAELPRAA
jgi:peptidoglycan/LPS O-acetylase OafA/YrhL